MEHNFKPVTFGDLFASLFKKNKIDDNARSYIWGGKEDELPAFYDLVINKYKLIDDKITFEQFKKIFTNQLIKDIEPLKWHDDLNSELLYLIVKLEESNCIVNKSDKTDYSKLEACFIKSNGERFKANWKQIKNQIGHSLKADKRHRIDSLIDELL